ncbi:MAG: glycoside hydrolase family 3 C-terminal domain-containing protein, partial [Candidatus Heimdallarchaeota archaeon]
LNWLDENLEAIIECFNPGLEGGNAIANVISGEVNPSGKLSISFPRHEGQLPIYYNQIPGWHGNSDGTGDYIDITHKPLYQFGFGLSYNDYEYSDLIIKNNKIKKKENLEIQISVKNKGKYNGKEIIQVYYNDIYSSVTTTKIQLVEFRKILLKPNEKKIVKFSIPANRFSLIDKNNERKIEEGEFEIMIGKSSDKMDLLKDIFSIID